MSFGGLPHGDNLQDDIREQEIKAEATCGGCSAQFHDAHEGQPQHGQHAQAQQQHSQPLQHESLHFLHLSEDGVRPASSSSAASSCSECSSAFFSSDAAGARKDAHARSRVFSPEPLRHKHTPYDEELGSPLSSRSSSSANTPTAGHSFGGLLSGSPGPPRGTPLIMGARPPQPFGQRMRGGMYGARAAFDTPYSFASPGFGRGQPISVGSGGHPAAGGCGHPNSIPIAYRPTVTPQTHETTVSPTVHGGNDLDTEATRLLGPSVNAGRNTEGGTTSFASDQSLAESVASPAGGGLPAIGAASSSFMRAACPPESTSSSTNEETEMPNVSSHVPAVAASFVSSAAPSLPATASDTAVAEPAAMRTGHTHHQQQEPVPSAMPSATGGIFADQLRSSAKKNNGDPSMPPPTSTAHMHPENTKLPTRSMAPSAPATTTTTVSMVVATGTTHTVSSVSTSASVSVPVYITGPVESALQSESIQSHQGPANAGSLAAVSVPVVRTAAAAHSGLLPVSPRSQQGLAMQAIPRQAPPPTSATSSNQELLPTPPNVATRRMQRTPRTQRAHQRRQARAGTQRVRAHNGMSNPSRAARDQLAQKLCLAGEEDESTSPDDKGRLWARKRQCQDRIAKRKSRMTQNEQFAALQACENAMASVRKGPPGGFPHGTNFVAVVNEVLRVNSLRNTTPNVRNIISQMLDLTIYG